MTVMLVIGLVFGAALVRLAFLLAPPRADAVVTIGRWDMARSRARRHQQQHDSGGERSVFERAALRISDLLAQRGVDLSRMQQNLAICGKTLEQHLARLLILVLAGLLAPVALGSVALAAGLAIPVQLPVAVGLLLGVAMAVLSHHELTQNADKHRAEFRRSLSIYLDLVAMSMEAGRGHPEALPAAADIGTGWTFELLQDTISGARYAGTTPWAALGTLGERMGIGELGDLAGSLSLASDEGSKVKASLTARAVTLRAKRLADAEGEANQASESMKFTLIAMVFAFFIYQLYPPIARLLLGG